MRLFRNHFAPVVTTFESQFKDDGDGFIYRKWGKGEAYRVSASERNKFIADFSKSITIGGWVLIAGIVLANIGIVLMLEHTPPDTYIWVLVVAFLTLFLGYFFWLYDSPRKALGRRTPAAIALTNSEVQKNFLSDASYFHFLPLPLVVPFIKMIATEEIVEGWNVWWLSALAIATLIAFFRMYQKWKVDRE